MSKWVGIAGNLLLRPPLGCRCGAKHAHQPIQVGKWVRTHSDTLYSSIMGNSQNLTFGDIVVRCLLLL